MPTQTFENLPEEKRQAIIDIAIDEFAANDYRNASVSRIVARAGIAKGSLYQYFADKRDLYLYLLDLATQEKLAFLSGSTPPDPQMGMFPYLRWLFDVGTRFTFTHPRLSQVAYRAIYGDRPFRDEVIRRTREASHQFFRGMIRQGIARGDIDPEIDPDLATFVITALMNELGNYLVERLGIDPEQLGESAEVDWSGMEGIVDNLLHILEHGMGKRQGDQQ